jgi:uncharacterized protein YjbI with pentapeptide repeats
MLSDHSSPYVPLLEKANRIVDLTGVDLSGADLYGVNLSGADLSGASLSGAFLGEVELNRAIVTLEHLEKARSLKDATMPAGLQYP